MHDCRRDFNDFQGNIWLNAASEGPLPKPAQEALAESIVWKSQPYLLDIPKFVQVPQSLKKSIGQLIGVSACDVILANSASYGIHVLANGIPWEAGDEVLLMQNDFPSDILPWLALEKKGVVVKQIKPKDHVLTPAELKENITKRTKLFCVSEVHTFTGIAVDVKNLSAICRDSHVLFVLNLSQSAGVMPVNLSVLDVDAATCAGYKWLCGPYGTGFAYIKPALREALDLNLAYWTAYLSAEELNSTDALKIKELSHARKFDVFCTANFFNFVPFNATIEYWLKLGMDNVWAYNQTLIDAFIRHLDKKKYRIISSLEEGKRSGMVFISHQSADKNPTVFKYLQENQVFPAFWKGHIRLSPHVYNTPEHMVLVADLLSRF